MINSIRAFFKQEGSEIELFQSLPAIELINNSYLLLSSAIR
jgi:hypothetical protein